MLPRNLSAGGLVRAGRAPSCRAGCGILRGSREFFERLAPFERSCIGLRQHRLQNTAHVVESDFLAIEFFRCAQREILHEEQIDFVAIDVRFVRRFN